MSSHLHQQHRGGETSVTQTEQRPQTNGDGEVGTLRLRPSPAATNGIAGPSRSSEPRRRRVVWSEGTVDNEGLGRKSSKICCIYHKPKAFDESSDSNSSSSGGDDSSDSDSDSSGHFPIGRSQPQPDSDSDANSGPETDGPNLSSSLRRKKVHQHQHDDSAACSRHRSKQGQTRRSRGSATQTVTIQPAPIEHAYGPNNDGEDGAHDSRQPSKPNAYERGPK